MIPAIREVRSRSETTAATPDTKLIDLPGLRADFAVRALTLEGIVCGLECQGIRKIRLPDGAPEEPFAVTLPVSIYVPSDKLSEAQNILRSLESDDVIGAQWEPVPEEDPNGDRASSSSLAEPLRPKHPDPFADAGPPRGESTTLRLVLFLIIAAAATYALAR